MTRRLLSYCGACALLALLPAEAAAADQLPNRKPGLWETKMVRTGSPIPDITMQECTDETTDKEMNGMVGSMAQMCSKRDIRKTATGYVSDTVCNPAGMSMSITSHSEMVGDFNSAYTVTTVSRTEGGPVGTRDSTSKIEAKWVGACKPDQKPGDIVMAGGHKINVMDALKKAQPPK